jgi:hypothetical protein
MVARLRVKAERYVAIRDGKDIEDPPGWLGALFKAEPQGAPTVLAIAPDEREAAILRAVLSEPKGAPTECKHDFGSVFCFNCGEETPAKDEPGALAHERAAAEAKGAPACNCCGAVPPESCLMSCSFGGKGVAKGAPQKPEGET